MQATAEAIVKAEPPVVLCGHSYGGMVITQAGADDRVTQLIYVTSVMPEAGQSLADLVGSQPTPWMDPGDDGTVGVHADVVGDLFLQDCDDVTARHALARLTRQSVTPFAQPARHVAWEDKASTYVVCSEDLAIPAELQRGRARASARVVDFTSGHHPFLSRPKDFARCIAAEIGASA